MKKKRTLPTRYARLLALVCCVMLLGQMLLACTKPLSGRPSSFATQTPFEKWGQQTATETGLPSEVPQATPVPWPTFAEPNRVSVTSVPRAAERLALDDDTKVWLLLGSEGETSKPGRTNAIHLVLINERLSKASVVSVPGNLFVYLPGHNMQRINSAYALGGVSLLRDTLAYNFGLRPDYTIIAHAEAFQWFVDDLGGVEISVLFPIRDACGGLPSGLHRMNGEKLLCYVSYISDGDEVNRTRRQQQALQVLFTKLVQEGRLADLAVMYVSYQDKIITDISLPDFVDRIPMALLLGDSQRVSYFIIGWESASLWELPDHTQTKVLLPDLQTMANIFGQALELINEAAPLNEIVLTYEWQLTEVVNATQTRQALDPMQTPLPVQRSATPTPSRTPRPTATPRHPYP